MQEVNIASVAVENVAYHFDKAYDYIVPDELSEIVQRGSRVMVSFGNGTAKRQGIVMDLSQAQPKKRMKNISAVLDKAPLVSNEMLDLAVYLKERTFCTLFEAVKLTLPTGINLKTTISFIALPNLEQAEVLQLKSDERQVLEYLINKRIYVKKQKVIEDLGLNQTTDVLERLLKKELVFRNYDAVRNINDASVRMMRIVMEGQQLEESIARLTKKQKSVTDLLCEVGSASVKEICYFTGVTPAVVNAVESKGIAEFFEHEILRNPYESKKVTDNSEIKLTDEQQKAYLNLLNQYKLDKGSVSLLFGITGSGKTQVFMKLIDEVSQSGKGVIVMVPEISLTPQTLSAFHARYGEKVAVFHSGLSLGERMDEWKRVKSGQAKIVVGTRSAVFAPFDDIGLIIMDEEQEHTYKSEASPRYHARDVAKFRCAKNNALLILASATPSFETYTAAQQGRYSLNVLKNRYGNAVLPQVIIVDMCKQRANGNKSEISTELYNKLCENIKENHQSILLMNRRGYNTFVSCESCGAVVTCPNCSISMTYHSANGRLMCHYCGHSQPFTEECESCGDNNVRYSGAGTQRVEDELNELIPEARILRMDTDTTMKRFSHEKKLAEFANGDYDIMLGTQMVAKGLDFENVTLVGVLSADQQLYNDDFKSMERTFDLLTQVVGRSGRGKHEGKAIIQTIVPENEVISLAAKQDYEDFYNTEMKIRKAMIYPPYCDLCSLGFSGKREMQVRAASKVFLDNLKQKMQGEYKEEKIIVLGPMPSRVARVNNKYKYRIIIKCKNSARFRNLVSELLIDFGTDSRFKEITAFADINPESIF
ncbi:MAG: primosomal protein N' [Clostridia bacterium]|nr:primosomal protein N' [Clostridia bacterium]